MDVLADESDVMTTSVYHSNGSNGSASQHLNGSASREEAKQVHVLTL